MHTIAFEEFCQLAGGIVLFLYGLRLASDKLRLVAGSKLKTIIKLLTANRFLGVVAGLLGTILVQSNTATAVILVGLCQAGVITLSRSIGVMLGANLGSTVTVQVVAFELYSYALLMIAAGFCTTLSIGASTLRYSGAALVLGGIIAMEPAPAFAGGMVVIGLVAVLVSFIDERKAAGAAMMGFGLIFVGMKIIGVAMTSLKHSPAFSSFIVDFQQYPLAVIAASFVFTVLTNSSTATLGTAIALVSAGGGNLIRPEGAVAIVMGAHLGSCPMAVLSSTGAGRIPRQVSFAHVFIKVAGVAVVYPFLGQFTALLTSFNDWVGASPARAVADAHTLFNLVNVITIIPFTPQVARLIERCLPERAQEVDGILKHISDEQMQIKTMALDSVELEMRRLAFMVRAQVREMGPAMDAASLSDLQRLQELDDQVDELFKSILDFLARLSREKLGHELHQRVMTLIYVLTTLEGIGDRISKGFHRVMSKRITRDVQLSFEGRHQLDEIHGMIMEAMDGIVKVLGERKADGLPAIIESHRKLMSRTRILKKAHFKQLIRGVKEAHDTSMIFLDALATMHDIHHGIVDIAQNLFHCPYYGGKAKKQAADRTGETVAGEGSRQETHSTAASHPANPPEGPENSADAISDNGAAAEETGSFDGDAGEWLYDEADTETGDNENDTTKTGEDR